MVSHTAKPVSCIARIGFSTVHDAVPPTALRRFNVLAEFMGSVEESIPKPHACKAAIGVFW